MQQLEKKLIAVTTNSASNMKGSRVGMVMQLERMCGSGFYRVWYAAHWLDLLVQAGLSSMFNKEFVHVIQGITGYLR